MFCDFCVALSANVVVLTHADLEPRFVLLNTQSKDNKLNVDCYILAWLNDIVGINYPWQIRLNIVFYVTYPQSLG